MAPLFHNFSRRSGLQALRLYRTLLLLLSLLFPFCSDASAVDLIIEMDAFVSVSGSPFPLSEAARLSGDPELVRKTGAFLLDIPPDGLLTRDTLLNTLVSKGIGGIRLKLVMPSAMRISLDESLGALVKRLSGWRWTVDVEPLGPVPQGRLVSPPSIPPGSGSATLRFSDDRGNERALAVRLSWSQPAVVATRPLERGAVIAAADVAVREVRVMRSQPLASTPDEVLGRRLGKNLQTGEPVLLNSLSLTPIIQRGDSVIITVRKPGFLIEVRGEALDAGAEGESIRVRNLQSRAVIQALVVGSGRVEVR